MSMAKVNEHVSFPLIKLLFSYLLLFIKKLNCSHLKIKCFPTYDDVLSREFD